MTVKESIQKNSKVKWVCIVTGSIVLTIVLAYILLHVVLLITGQESTQDLDDFGNVLDMDDIDDTTWMDSQQEDPYLSDNSTQVWAHSRGSSNGLTLEIYNALDNDWQTLFDAVISDWQESEALNLKIQRVDVDHSCKRVQGVMKVCNANLGDTGFLGFNEIETVGDVIVSSVAQLNEYYLYNADQDRKRFTLCHELGHGFGLPHTDENPYNRDRYDCMDYTSTPENNLHPGVANFQRLASMYLEDDDDEYQEQAQGREKNRKGGKLRRRVVRRHFLSSLRLHL